MELNINLFEKTKLYVEKYNYLPWPLYGFT